MPDNKPDDQAPNPVDKVLEEIKELSEKVNSIKPPEEKNDKTETVPDRRAQLQKALGYTDEQMAAHEASIRDAQAPLVEKSGWDAISGKTHFEKYKKEIEDEVKLYPIGNRTPDIMTKIYQMIVGRHADSAPPPPPPPKSGRVESSRVSGGPGYSGSEGGQGSSDRQEDKSQELEEWEKRTAEKLGVDEKRYALSRNAGRDITPLRKPDDRPAASGADLELKRLQGSRR